MNKKITIFCCLINLLIGQMAQSQTPQLWGTTSSGGSHSEGTVFKISGDGTGYQVVTSLPTGSEANGTLVKFSDNNLYGTCPGTNALGIIFNVNPTIGVFNDLYNFNSDTCIYPEGSLVSVNGVLYGYTSNGGSESHGAIYSFAPSTGRLSILHNFNDTTGCCPLTAGLTLADDGSLYGTTWMGGANNDGVLFNLNPSNNTYTDVHNFDIIHGANPDGRVIEVNGIIYGMASEEGAQKYGVIYSYNPATATYTDIYDFNGSTGNDPEGDLVYYKGLFYGMTYLGGTYGVGVIFSYNLTSQTYSDLYDFDSNGTRPDGGFCLASDGKLYGLTLTGGTNGDGTIFKYDETDSVFTLLYSFGATDTDAVGPQADLIDLLGSPSGINTVAAETNFSVYPNPTVGNVTITSEKNIDEVKVTNVLGQLVYQSFSKQTQAAFDIKNEGIYFITVTSGNESTTQK